MESETLEVGSLWSSEGNDALFGVLRGGRTGLTFGMFRAQRRKWLLLDELGEGVQVEEEE